MTTTPLTIAIPDDLDFSELKLARDADGHVSFAWEPIEQLCTHNGLDIALFNNAPEDNVASLITAWYAAHLQQGGAPDAVQDDLIAEALLEDAHGGGISHAPGRA